jgi:hypothetical protein
MPPDVPDEPNAPPPPAPVDAEGGNCPRCGTPYEPLQEYCLECGLRLPVARGVVAVLSSAWRRRIPWYPGDWIWPVLLGLVIAALGATFAILATRDDDESSTRTQVATTAPTLPGTGTGEEPPAPTGTGTGAEPPPPAETETEPVEPPPPPTGPGGLTEWPPGQSGYTVVLLSLPESGGQGPAVRAGQQANGAGLPEVGVLNSSDFSSLHPGYYVVFSGIYNSLDEARSALDTARASYPQAYTRQIAQ